MKTTSLLVYLAILVPAHAQGSYLRGPFPVFRREDGGRGRGRQRNDGRDNNNNNGDEEDPQIEEGDLDIRFSKVFFPNGDEPNDFLPLQAEDYPMRGEVASILKERARAASIVTFDDYEIHGANARSYINAIGGSPSMPNSDPSHAYWKELEDVIDYQLARLRGDDPNKLFRLPSLWESYDIDQVAEAVHDEYPGLLQAELLQWLWSEGVTLDKEILPFRSSLDFIGTQVRMADLNTWAIGAVAPINFHLKWYEGRPRPEEVAYMIHNGHLTTEEHGVPSGLVTKIQGMTAALAPDLTAYPEGSPVHPSWPAMHSAASSASFWLAVILDLDEAHYCEALRVDYAVAFARTVAGVHYPTDNIAGLNLGQEIMARKLVDHLVETYGSDRGKVIRKIDSLRFDWNDFDPQTCSRS